LIPIGLLLLIFKRDTLIYVAIFFSSFTASSVLNIKFIKYGLQPSYYFSLLWMLSIFVELIANKNFRTNSFEILRKYKIVYIPILCLIVSAAISLAMPIIIPLLQENIQIHPISSPWGIYSNLTFSRKNITQFMYVGFYSMIPILLLIKLRNKNQIIRCIRALFISTAFTVFWGIFQFISYYLHIKYPYYLFNNNIGYSQGWAQLAWVNLKRVNSVAAEASTYSFYLLMGLSLLVVLILHDVYLLNKRFTHILFGGVLITLILTTSTTAYLGFIFLLIFMFVYLLYLKAITINKTIFLMVISKLINFTLITASIIMLIIILILFYSHKPYNYFLDIIKSLTLNKAQTISGLERVDAMKEGLKLFSKSPLFGVGIGSNRTFDMVTTLLSSTGIAGMLSFILIIVNSIKISLSSFITSNKSDIKYLSLGLALSVIVGIFTMAISIPDLNYLFFWFVIGLIFATKKIEQVI